MHILLAESDPRLANVYADFIGGLGHEVRVVSGSSAALDQWQSWPPDVVILDMAISALSSRSSSTRSSRPAGSPSSR